MGKVIKMFFCVVLALCANSCSNTNDIEDEPQIVLSDISGVWLEYAYFCSDGYFVDISDTGYNMYYEFDVPNTFMQYTVDEDGVKHIKTQGEWTYDPQTQIAHIKEPRGWNLDIKFSFENVSNGGDSATMIIKGRTDISSSIIKAKRIQP